MVLNSTQWELQGKVWRTPATTLRLLGVWETFGKVWRTPATTVRLQGPLRDYVSRSKTIRGRRDLKIRAKRLWNLDTSKKSRTDLYFAILNRRVLVLDCITGIVVKHNLLSMVYFSSALFS